MNVLVFLLKFYLLAQANNPFVRNCLWKPDSTASSQSQEGFISFLKGAIFHVIVREAAI
jgi:hypothetical protein